MGLTACADQACFQWTKAEGPCPNQADAQQFFGTCNTVRSVESDGDFQTDNGGLCCYTVKKNDFTTSCIPSGG
jgi:hypothetical protein